MAGGERGSASGFLLACLLLFAAGLVTIGALYGVLFVKEERDSAPASAVALATPATIATITPTLPPEWVGPDGEREHEYVTQDGAYIIGGDERKMELFNNPDAKNPSWLELKMFLRWEETDQ